MFLAPRSDALRSCGILGIVPPTDLLVVEARALTQGRRARLSEITLTIEDSTQSAVVHCVSQRVEELTP